MPAGVLEIEQKYRVESFDAVLAQLNDFDVTASDTQQEHDTYFAHPVRDFATTDEAFRIRSIGSDHVVTYKGPRTGGVVKTREEIEFPIGDASTSREKIVAFINALGFETVADVEKTRETRRLPFQHHDVAVTFDAVTGLPPHVEVEVVSDDQTTAEAAVQALAARLGLANLEPRSYLELVLEAKSG